MITEKIQVDFTKGGAVPVVWAVQGDHGSREAALELLAGGEPWPVPAGAAVLIRYACSDGTGGSYDTLPDGSAAWRAEENVLTVALAPQVCAQAGNVLLGVTLLWGDCQLSTFQIIVRVSAGPEGGAPGENYTNLAQWLRENGTKGDPGKSAYALALDHGFVGTEAQWLASLKGQRGETGAGVPGLPGRTPVKGVDYWTAADKAEILGDQGAPLFVNSVADCTDSTRVYLLPDGFLYAYLRSQTVSGTPNAFMLQEVLLNTRLDTLGTAPQNGMLVTNYIPVDFTIASPYVVRISGGVLDMSQRYSNARLHFYDSGKNQIGNAPYLMPGRGDLAPLFSDGEDWVIWADYFAKNGTAAEASRNPLVNLAEVRYIRLCLNVAAPNAITAREASGIEIHLDSHAVVQERYAWENTGRAYTPADYQDRILALEAAVADLAARL